MRQRNGGRKEKMLGGEGIGRREMNGGLKVATRCAT